MRIKNFTLLFLMGIFGLFSTNVFAQDDATIAPENIRYWIGEGENQVIFIVNWNEPDTALAWGYRVNAESLTVKDLMDDIAAADHRFDYQAGGHMITEVTYSDDYLHLALVGQWWMYNINGITASEYYDVQTVQNGDVVKVGDESCGIIIDPVLWTYVWTEPVVAVYPLADDAKIDSSEILYWIGEGDSQVVFAVNWADPDVCYAWGYRFSSLDTVMVKDVMDGIAATDGRFFYVPGAWGVSDIVFNEGGLHLALAGAYWLYNINGYAAQVGYDEQVVIDGDFIKWGDEACGTLIGPWTYVWETPVQPVTAYDAVSENDFAAMSLYPNPATSFTMLKVETTDEAVVTVTDLQGRVLRSFAVRNDNEPIRIETEGFQAGLYFVTVSTATSRQTVKLSVK